MTFHARYLRLAAALAVLATLAGCMSMVGFGYGHADTVAAWKADQYFDLDSDQKQAFRARFDRLYAWHRYEQLPEYAAFLTAARQRLQNGLTAEDVEWFADGVESRYRILARRAAPDAADLLATLKPHQIEHLRERWDKDNRKFASEHRLGGTVAERKRERAKRIVSQIRNWAGSLTGEQETRIAKLADALPDTERMRYEDRIRRQREFVQLMGERGGDRKAFADRLAHWLVSWEEGCDPEYRRITEAAWPQRMQMFVAIERMLTAEQRSHLIQRLQQHIGEFQRLSRPG